MNYILMYHIMKNNKLIFKIFINLKSINNIKFNYVFLKIKLKFVY